MGRKTNFVEGCSVGNAGTRAARRLHGGERPAKPVFGFPNAFGRPGAA